MNPYDEIPYLGRPFRKTHPDRLATIATLRGLGPPRVDRCRVLELGCAVGGNLLPMAEQLPEARFVGIDGSARQIETSRHAAQAAGLTNVEFMHCDLRSVGAELGEFDYIIAHGIFSWVPTDAQDKILAICGQQLAPHGVAFVSYNCYPGWHLRGTVHHLLRFATRDCGSATQSIHRARRLSEVLANSIGAVNSADATALQQELELIGKQDDSYVYHEYLEDVNEPVYVHEFMERAIAHGLQYVADSEFGMMSPDNLPHPVKQQVAGVASDPLELEQFFDFVKNRKFRQTLLCRSGAALDRPNPDRVRRLHVASGARTEGAVDLNAETAITYRGQSGAMVSREPLVKAAMLELAEHWPQAVLFDSLVARARGRLPTNLATVPATADDASLLAGLVLTGFSSTLIELSTQPSTFTLQPSERPLGSPIARRQAESSETVTNRRHESVGLDYLQRLMLRFLDGEHDRAAVVAGLLDLVQDGTLAVHDAGQRVPNGARARGLLAEAVEANLGTLALLVG